MRRRTMLWKLFCWIFLTTRVFAYQSSASSKTEYIDSQWRHKMASKGYNKYASLLMSSTTKSPWPRANYASDDSNVRLRHSRYPHLENVMTRLEKMQPTTKAPTTTTSTKSYYHHKYSSKLFHDYDDEAYDDDVEDKDDNVPDYDDWENEEEDDPEEDDDLFLEQSDENNWQAEEATETAPSSLTEYKWQHYGTRSRVEESRLKQNYPEHSSSYLERNAAIEHALRMSKESRCRKPAPKVVSIQSVHPNPGKSYIPHCTVLHRCAEDTGCCSDHATKCGPKRQTKVYLYFYVTKVGKSSNRVEKLEFYNHTECACLDRFEEVETDYIDNEENREISRPYRSSLSVKGVDLYSSPETIRTCKCPEEFNSGIHRGSYCTCDCSIGNEDCFSIKKGNEFFSLKDRLCISNSQCGLPSCEYGAYMRHIGRCPRKQEKIEAFANQNT